MKWRNLETHCCSSADDHPLHKVYHFLKENSSETYFVGAQLGSETDAKQGETGSRMWGNLQILQRKETEIKNKTWGPGRKIHCQVENRVIARPAKDLMQHRTSSTTFLICRKLRFMSLITLPCGFLFELCLLDQVVRSFPQATLHGIPKLSEVPQRAGGTCLWAKERSARSGSGSGPDSTHEDVIYMWAGWAQSAHHGGQSTALLTNTPAPHCLQSTDWLTVLTMGLSLLPGPGQGRDIWLILSTHTSCTGRAQRNPAVAALAPAATGEQAQRAWLGASLLTITMSVVATESSPRISPLSLIREEMSNLRANIYTLAFKCRHFSLHGESWPWCFFFIICLLCNSRHHWACCWPEQMQPHLTSFLWECDFIFPNDYVQLELCCHNFSSSSEVNIKNSPCWK